MIDHTGHPHPSTPKARALCRANGGTGFIGKIGGNAPTADKKDNDKPIVRKTPHIVDVTPDKPKAPVAPPRGPTVPKGHGVPKPPTTPKIPPTAKPVSTVALTPDQKTALTSDRASIRQLASNNLYDEFVAGRWFDKKERGIDRKPAVREYFGNSTRINSALRKGKLDPKTQELVNQVDEAFSLTKTKTPLVVFRGVSKDLIKDKEKGDTVTDSIYWSTAVDPQQAKKFARSEGSVLLHIEVPEGTPVIAENATETEVLLARGSSIQIIKIDGDNVYGKLVPTNTVFPPPPKVPFKPPVGMGSFIPPAMGSSPQAQIQNAMRRGASRDFIVSRSKLTPEETDREIDRLLTQYGVPNHIYPRKGSGGTAPKISDVKPAPPKEVAKKVADTGSVETPSGPASIGLTKVRGTVNVNPEAHEAVHRVLTIQESHVKGKITRIRGIDNELPDPDSVKGRAWQVGAGTLAVCENDGHVHLHKDIHSKNKVVNYAMESGWFTKGGTGIEQTIAHEMGHAFLTDAKMTPGQRKQIVDVLVSDFGLTNPLGSGTSWYGGLLDRVVAHPANNVKIKRAVSKYGATNANELMAEVWAEYTMNPKPRPRIKKLGDVLKGIIGEGLT